ncbi:MAG: 6-carboxytetrahydropterin synthase QueD [Planctomycetota bacterium]
MRVTKEFVFDAAHNLPRYKGKCEKLHGHTWRVQVTVEGPVNPADGMTLDFCILRDIVKKETIDVLDHSYLNDHIENPSAENIALWIWNKIQGKLPVRLAEVKVWETPTSFVSCCGD